MSGRKRGGPSAAGAGPGPVSGLRELAARGDTAREALLDSAKKSGKGIKKLLQNEQVTAAGAVLTEDAIRRIVREENKPLAKEKTLLELKENVLNLNAAVSYISSTLDTVKEDVSIIRGQGDAVRKQLKKLVREGSGISLLYLIVTMLAFIWSIIVFIWNLLTNTTGGAALTLLLETLVDPFVSENSTYLIVKFLAVVVLLATHAIRTSINVSVSKNGKPIGKYVAVAFDIFVLYQYIIEQNPTDDETIQMFKDWVQGLLNTADDYIVQFDIKGKIYRFAVENRFFTQSKKFVEFILRILRYALWEILVNLISGIKNFFMWLFCTATGNWFSSCAAVVDPLALAGGAQYEIATMYTDMSKDSRVLQALAGIAFVSGAFIESKDMPSEANIIKMVPIIEYLFALDNIYSRQIDRIFGTV
jgi:hypothetical protein